MSSIKKSIANPCAGCYYRKPISGFDGGLTACHYMLNTGEKRGCRPEECKEKGRYRARTAQRKKRIPKKIIDAIQSAGKEEK